MMARVDDWAFQFNTAWPLRLVPSASHRSAELDDEDVR